MKRVILAIAFVTLFSSNAYAENQRMGNWTVRTEIDAFDDSKKVYARLISEEIVFILRCRKEINLFIVTSPKADSKKFDNDKVGTRVGKNAPLLLDWNWVRGKAMFHPSPIALMNEIAKSDSNRLIVRTGLDNQTVTEIFDTSGANKVFQMVKDACGVKGNSS